LEVFNSSAAHPAPRFFRPKPYDFLAAALASCTAIAVRVFADRHAMSLERIEVEVSPFVG
jgi:uncharacterized OsmC-like protein